MLVARLQSILFTFTNYRCSIAEQNYPDQIILKQPTPHLQTGPNILYFHEVWGKLAKQSWHPLP